MQLETNTMEYTTACTMLIVRDSIADLIVKKFIPNYEIGSLSAIRFFDLSECFKFMDINQIKRAKEVSPNAKIKFGYMWEYIVHHHPYLCEQLEFITNKGYKIICQIEYPKKEYPEYQNIDIGLTSNGKCRKNETIHECAMRETFEEAQIILNSQIMSYENQMNMRYELMKQYKNINLNIPLEIAHKPTMCYIIII